jgi:acetoin utilization protein AcuB
MWKAISRSAAGQLVAADVMTPLPVTVRPDCAVSDAAALMIRRQIRHLPVTDSTSTLVGMLSKSDLREAIGDLVDYLAIKRHLVTAEPRVSEVMTAPVVVVLFDCPLVELARKFGDEHVGAIAVNDKFGALVGIVSYLDVLRVLADRSRRSS